MQSWWTAESESQPYLYKWQFHVMATCIKCICDGIPVLLPISKNIFHSGRKQKHWQSFTQNYQTNTFFSFSVLTTHSETQQLKADCAFFQLLRTDTRDYMYLYGKGSCIPSLSFLVLLLGASPLPGFKKKKKKNSSRILGTLSSDQQFLCSMKILFGSSPGIISTSPVVSFNQWSGMKEPLGIWY